MPDTGNTSQFPDTVSALLLAASRLIAEPATLGETFDICPKADEVRTFTQIARRIAAIPLMEDDLDASYRRCSADTWDWQAAVEAAKSQRPVFGDLHAPNR